MCARLRPYTFVQAHLDGDALSVSFINRDNPFDISELDDMAAMAWNLSNSETGRMGISLTGAIYRFICSNGVLSPASANMRKRHISTSVLDSLPEMMAEAMTKLERMKEQFRISLDTPVSDPEATIETINRQFQLDKLERDAVAWGYQHEPGESMFEIVQAYSKSPQKSGLPAYSCNRLERVAGQVVAAINADERRLAA